MGYPARPLTESSWDEDEIALELAQEFGIDDEDIEYDIEVTEDSNFGVSYWTATVSRNEYLVFESDDDAEEYAREYVRQQLEDDPQLFTSSWLENFLYISSTDRRLIAQDLVNYIYDLDDDDLAERADIEDKLEAAEEYDVENGTDLVTELLDAAREKLAEDEAEEIEQALERDPVGYFVDDQGIYSMEDLLKQSFIQIDYEEAAVDAIRSDGVARFLASYDGEERETNGGLVYYRTN